MNQAIFNFVPQSPTVEGLLNACLAVLPHVPQPEKTVLVKALREFETFGDSAKEHSPDVDDSHGGLAQPGTAPNQSVGSDMSDYISVVTIQQGLAALEDGTSVDLTKIQAALNEAFAETGDRDYMKASDELSRLTGLEQTAQGFVMVPSPAGSTIGGFTVGHAARMNGNKTDATIVDVFRSGGDINVVLEFDEPQPVDVPEGASSKRFTIRAQAVACTWRKN